MSVRITLKAALILAGLSPADADRDLDELIAEDRAGIDKTLEAERRKHAGRSLFSSGIEHARQTVAHMATPVGGDRRG